MVDNKDEYQLPEDEKTEEYTPKAYQNSTENILSMLKNQRTNDADGRHWCFDCDVSCDQLL